MLQLTENSCIQKASFVSPWLIQYLRRARGVSLRASLAWRNALVHVCQQIQLAILREYASSSHIAYVRIRQNTVCSDSCAYHTSIIWEEYTCRRNIGRGCGIILPRDVAIAGVASCSVSALSDARSTQTAPAYRYRSPVSHRRGLRRCLSERTCAHTGHSPCRAEKVARQSAQQR